jgi:hypothetical protein
MNKPGKSAYWKYAALLPLFSLVSLCARSQGMYGFEFGVGRPSFWIAGRIDHERFTPSGAPTATVNYLAHAEGHLYFGAGIQVAQYMFDYIYTFHSSSQQVNHKSTFALLPVSIDLAMGKKRSVHSYFSLSPGFLLDGSQQTTVPYYNSFSTRYTSDGISRTLLRLGFGFRERILLRKSRLEITIDEGYSFMTGNLTETDPDIYGYGNSKSLHPGYFYLMTGLQRKFKSRPRTTPNAQPQPAISHGK